MATVRRFISIALLLVFAVVGATVVASPAHGQTTGNPQGSVSNNVYTNPEAGFSFALPEAWTRSNYQWTEYWGTSANARRPGADTVVEWTYSPRVSTNRAATLLTLVVYPQDEWDGDEADVVAESADFVYVAMMAETNPYTVGSTDAQRFESLMLSMDEVQEAFSLTTSASNTPGAGEPATPATTFVEPDLWCEFAGTGATITVNSERANFTCDTEDNSNVVLAGNVTQGDDGWMITQATIANGRATNVHDVMVTHIELEDGTVCAESGTGATFPANGERVNFTCEEAGVVLAGDIEQTDDGWEIMKANVIRTDDGFETTSFEMAVIAALGVAND